MHETADLQDKGGQGEVDIPVREMLADILLDLKRPKDALAEYERDLQLSRPLQWSLQRRHGRRSRRRQDKSPPVLHNAA